MVTDVRAGSQENPGQNHHGVTAYPVARSGSDVPVHSLGGTRTSDATHAVPSAAGGHSLDIDPTRPAVPEVPPTRDRVFPPAPAAAPSAAAAAAAASAPPAAPTAVPASTTPTAAAARTSRPAHTAERPRERGDRLVRVWSVVSSIPVLAALLAVTIVLAAGPMHDVDHTMDHHFLYHMAPQLMPLVQGVLDKFAGQAVCLPVLALVAIVLSVRRRSWRPVLVGFATEMAFLIGIGGMKVLLARPSPPLDDPDLWDGGIIAYGEKGISFPSGHSSEAVLIYGAAVYLIARYGRVSRTVVVLLGAGVALIAVNSVVVAVWLGWHWLSDLFGGLAAGALCLRIVIWWDRRWLWPPCRHSLRARGPGRGARAGRDPDVGSQPGSAPAE